MISWICLENGKGTGKSYNQYISKYIRSCLPRWLSWIRRPTGDQEVPGSTPAKVGNFLSWRLIMKYFLWSFSPFGWFKKGSSGFQPYFSYYSYFSQLFFCVPTFPYFFLKMHYYPYFLVQKCLKWPKTVIFFPSSLKVCKNWINLIWAVTMQKFMKYFYFSCNSFLEHLFSYFFTMVM